MEPRKAELDSALTNLYLDKVKGLVSKAQYIAISRKIFEISPELLCRLRDSGAPKAELRRLFPDADEKEA